MKMLLEIWTFLGVMGLTSGQYVKGGSSEHASRFSQSEATMPCDRPSPPMNGRISCTMMNNHYSCKGNCNPGYQFPDSTESYSLECSQSTGLWTPFQNFPDCEGGSGGGGYSHSSSSHISSSSGGGYGGSSLSHTSGSSGGGYAGSSSSHMRGSSGSGFAGSSSSHMGSYDSRYEHSMSGQAASACETPDPPMNGRVACTVMNDKYSCKGTCNPGFKFPDGLESYDLQCSKFSGQWTPYRNFPDCKGSYGDGYAESVSSYSSSGDSRYSHSGSAQGSFGQAYSHGSSIKTSGQGLCGQPKNPLNGAHHCSMSNGQWTCQATCNPGYEFPDRTRQVSATCNDRDGIWSPKKDFEDCQLLCHPPCENGGRCAVHNQCICSSTFRGIRCQYSVSLCDFKRLSSGTLYNDCTHNPEYTECLISCPPGATFNPPSTSIFRCTVDGKWNPPIAPTCVADNLCERPPPPTNGRVECRGSSEIMMCTGYCMSGYIFQDGFSELNIQCVKATGRWAPSIGFPDCEAICSPECQNGGRCLGHNNCLCTREFRGSRCEYPLSNCDGHERFASVAYQCQTNSKETVCTISCSSGSTLQPPQHTKYTCSFDGTWVPDLKPICVSDYSHLMDARSGSYGGHGQGSSSSWSSSSSGSQQMSHRYTGEHQGFEGQQRIGHEFGGQQSIGNEFGGQQSMGHEFGGQQGIGHEFGGQQSMENGFTGERMIGHEYTGQRDISATNFGHSGQQMVGNEFGSQQVMDTEFGGQQSVEHEFLGQESVDYDFGGQQTIDESFAQISRKTVLESGTPSGVKTASGKVGYQRETEDYDDQNSRDLRPSITKTINIFSSKRKASNFKGICSTWGFYHYRTFDGGVYTFPSSCWYILAASSVDDIVISVKSECTGELPCDRIVRIQHADNRYLLSYANGLSRNGISLAIPVQNGDMVVEYVSRYVVARTNFGYAIWINDENSVLLVAEPFIQHHTRGMCGNDDGNLDPFFACEDGTKSSDIFEFASSWKLEDLDGVCVETVEPKTPCNSETRENRMVSDKANLACSAFYDAEFEACGEVLDVEVYYLKCQMDCCSTNSVENCECSSLAEFVLECSRSGVDMSRGWRKPGLCPLMCKYGTEYRQCGPQCPATCSDQQPICSQQKCVDGCHCPRGTVLEDGQCIPVEECPCHMADKIYATGERTEQDCNTCVCLGGNWECTESLCPSSCSLSGPHITTFDGLNYDFHGRCPHYIVDGADFSVSVDYHVDCIGGNPASGVCVSSITIHTTSGAVVELKPSMEVMVNGREMKSMPVLAPGIYVGQATSTYMKAQLNNGLEILWDLGSFIHVYAPVELFGSLKGLCGTFTKNQHDEFLTPEGDIETSSGVFALKWRVEEHCRGVGESSYPEGSEKACDRFPERRHLAAEACGVLKRGEFKVCHDTLDYDRYYSDCMEDVCSCKGEPMKCACQALANYATACARKEKPVSWRLSVPECGIPCPHGQIYTACANPCSYSCGEIAHAHEHCRDHCVEGCACPPGRTLDDHGQCSPVSSCSCLHSGHSYPPEFVQRRGADMCECLEGNWDCHKASPSDLILTPPPDICDAEAHFVPTDCKSECPVTCSNYHHYQPCTVAVCAHGCSCQEGFILDTTTGSCVRPVECPCHHGGKSFSEGEETKMDCNNCVCEGGSWRCDTDPCPALCSAWGGSHFETFDGHLFDFDGTCAYVLAKAKISDSEFFAVVVQNVPCGVESTSICGKTVSVQLGDSSVILTRIHPLPIVPVDSRLTVTSVGMFTLVDSDIGLSVQWDRNTRVYVTAQPVWKNKMLGLCGDFNSDATDDFKSPSGGKPLVLPKDFADSWRVYKFCPLAKHSEDACETKEERRSWSQEKCGVLKSDLFIPCHFQVPVEEYYKRCVSDACGCSSGGDCECLCAVVSTYAQKCARSGVVIPWRSQDLCPIQCEACDRYSPCISLCPPPNCDTYLSREDSRSCKREYCVDGCDAKPCAAGKVHRSASNLTCVPAETCGEKPCIMIEGVPYREGERIDRPDVGDACQSCYCRRGKVECMGVPCTISTTTFRPLELQVLKECTFTGWTEWINSISPEDNEGNDSESLEQLAKTSRIPCPLDHVKRIECRTVETQEIAEATSENVTCNLQGGMKCWKSARTGECNDYEIKVYCQCREEATCPPGQIWDECAFDCDNSCQSLLVDLEDRGLCDGQACVEGCTSQVCQHPYLMRDADTCVTSDQCTCRLESGYILAPGQVVTNGCEKCQCLNNTLTCSTTAECKKPHEEVKEVILEEPPELRESFLSISCETSGDIERPTRHQLCAKGLVLTTPMCSYWSEWINKGKPKPGRKHGDREATRPYILKQTEGFCMKGDITDIECREATTDQDYRDTNEEKLVCSLNKGFQCQNRNQPDEMCKDYKIRYFCSCTEESTPVPLFIQTTPQTYVYPCVEFVPLIDGPDRLPDANIKASSSASSFSGPDGARFKTLGPKGAKKTWTAGQSNDQQFIEVDVGEVRGIYGIITKGKELSSEWVTSYQILYSKDGVSYAYYQDDNDNNMVFSGNFDDTHEVKHFFKRPFEARFIRIEPLTWERKISLKLELLGCLEAITQTAGVFPVESGRSEDVVTKTRILPVESERGETVFTVPASHAFDLESGRSEEAITKTRILPVESGRGETAITKTRILPVESGRGETAGPFLRTKTEMQQPSSGHKTIVGPLSDLKTPIKSHSLVIQTTPKPPKECLEPIGLQNGALMDSQFSATSSFSSASTPENARLGSDSAWVAAVSEDEQYLQVDFVNEANITGIITKGRESVPQWVTAYVVTYSKDGVIWNKIKNDEGTSLMEFPANYDPYTPVTNEFPAMIRARLLRIWPTNWKNWISMQIEILGCYQPQPCRDPMDVDDLIANYQRTSSSKISDFHSAAHGRLSSLSSWIPAKNDKNPFLQIDLLEPVRVTAVITKGDPESQQWVKSFFIAYSNDSLNWKKAEQLSGKAKQEFIGNEDQNSPVINVLPIPFTSRYVQIIPSKWHRWISMRTELLGCKKEQECREPMGLENGVLADGQISATSSLDWNFTPSHARMSDRNGWIADTADKNPSIEVDFLEPRNVSAVVTKGTGDNDYWVTKYKVLFSEDNKRWYPVIDFNGHVIKFPGNIDSDTPVINTFPETIEAQYFRIVPVDYHNKIGMRLELLGCYHPFVCEEPMGLETGVIYDFQITASTSANPELGPEKARLGSDSGWVAELGDTEPYLQIDFMTPANITGIMTRGRSDVPEWVNLYEVSYSDDGLDWLDIKDGNGDTMVFNGNRDNESPATIMFPASIFSRYLRIRPTHYEKKVGLRLEVLGCAKEKLCMEPMGLENGLLSDSHISASSYKTDETSPEHARLNSKTSWSAAATEGAPQFIKVDFGALRNISGLVTKGNADDQSWVTSFQVSYSKDGDKWFPVRNALGEVIEFPGNKDAESPVINVLPETLEIQYIKIIPTDWKNWISLRTEVLGCYHPYGPIIATTEPEEEVLAMTYIPTEPTLVAACPNPMEVESSLLKDAILEASSSTPNGPTSRIGLYTIGQGGLSGGWVPAVEDLHPVLLVVLPDVKWVTSIFVQGREDEENWVKSLRVIASKDNKTWLPVFGPNGDEIIDGNEDRNNVVGHYFKKPMEAKFVKIIPETWHRWPSFRLDLRGCHVPVVPNVPTSLGTLALCPELEDEPEMAFNCPSVCPPGLVCDGQECVDPLDCSCFHDGKLFKVGDKMEDHSCMQCDCSLGGRTVCAKKVCPPCSKNDRSILNDDCSCLCEPCESNEVICPSSHECIPKERWCDGIVDCPDDETNCISTSTEKPTTSAESLLPIPPLVPGNAECDVMGKHIKTFDGQDITYDICHHVVMKEVLNGDFNVSLHKECDFSGDCRHWLELLHKGQKVKVFTNLRVELNGHNYTASQLPKLGVKTKSKATNLVINMVGDQVTIQSPVKGFTLVYDTNGHLKIEVSPSLKKRIGGLCGYYSGFPEDDQRKPDGKKAFTSQEFGDSWASDDAKSDCAPLVCPHEVMARALEQCNKLRSEPFGGCSKALPIDHFIEFCMSSTCECMIHNKISDEKCKCDSFQPFAEACENELGPLAIRNWRFIHGCHTECPPGMEWNDCGPSCQLTCNSNPELEQCSEKCVPGCFCAPGTVLSDDKCMPPEQCADQTCQGFGDPHFLTFDGLFYPFQAEGTFLIVGDRENDFALKGFSRRCSLFTRVTCMTGLQVLYKGNIVTIKKHMNVEVNGVKIPMDKLPLYTNGMVTLGYPGRTFVVSIPLMNLEARYYEDNSGFAVKVPSQKYFNKTEGLCGNCNRKKEDELKGKPLSEFVCSFQMEGDQNECKKAMEDLPVLNERVELCKGLENPVFEACHPLVDYEVYIDACSFDATNSGEPKSSLCKTAIEYARQCCQAGISVEEWPEVLDCEMKCPSGLKYSQCHEGCPQTCSSLKNSSSCSELKIDGCFCPAGKVLMGDECVDSISCDTCDEDGHMPFDEWKIGKCKKCLCKTDLTTECSVEVCPNKPICNSHEMLARVNNEQEDSCCESYSCVPKIENCPQVDVPDCPKGEVAKIYTRRDLCAEFRCECDPALCPAIVWPSDMEEGEVAEMVNDSCCRKMQVSCHPDSCPDKPHCRKGLELRETEGECCTKYKCKPPEDICVYTNSYKVVDGLQVKLKSEDTSPSLHKPGDEWTDGLCEKCKCVESNGQHAPLCVMEQCPRMDDLPENKEYVLHEMKIPGKCCPDIFRINCKDEEGNVYEEGEHWRDIDDPCINYVCEGKDIGGVQKSKNVINCTECPRNAVYFPPSKILGQCCGVCRITRCEDAEKVYEVGDTWVNEDQPCRKAECVKEYGIVKIVYTRQPCPTIPKDCPKNKITWDDKGCCEICNATSEISCSTGPIPLEDTIGFFSYRDDNRGGECVNEKPVPNVLKCSGACHSESYYSLEDGDFKDTCKCCKVNITINRTVDLVCPDRSRLKKSFVQPETCQCSKCAPKSGSRFLDKYEATERPQPWKSVKTAGSAKSPWEDMQTSRFGQVPLQIGQQVEQDEEEIEQIGQEVQQEDYDNLFDIVQQQPEDHGGMFEPVQQQQQDHGDMFEPIQQQQQDHGNMFEPIQQQQQDHGNMFEPIQQQDHGNMFEPFQQQQQDHGSMFEPFQQQQQDHDNMFEPIQQQQQDFDNPFDFFQQQQVDHD
ncbi:hypothetical protein JTE90_010656 [Oedothorax gibbosus]|uniref:Uncharacterized protein n=1 Tax=Oedothorax gibbosus TaxID=931172 RepID=A0AAV6USL4_9ARAC|nr:hypothetical protein JTE90_010656 [Oedothorax gibbosus]